MPIVFDRDTASFHLTTRHTAYVFTVVDGTYPMHLYYGNKDTVSTDFKAAYRAFSPYPAKFGSSFSPTDDLSEFAFYGSGDYRCSSLRIRNANGDSCTLFTYDSYEIFRGRREIPRIPFARAEEDTETLAVRMRDDVTGCILTLYYTLFPSCDVISRSFSLENAGDAPVTIEKAMSLCLDIPGHDFDLLSLHGAHTQERQIQRVPVSYGVHQISSLRGASSHQFNPFIALLRTGATEEAGEVYGFNFVFSGSFCDEVEVEPSGNTRVGIGLGSENFSYTLMPGETFDSPEAVMTFSNEGLGGMSRSFHRFVRDTILPPDPFGQRPVVLNTWEACYFDIDEQKLIDFAEASAASGIDMLVMDDGWFGKRDNDDKGLGDWYANPDKFPDGLCSFVEKVRSKGVKFGIWIEPEMVNPDSDLYRAHPDWCLRCVGREPSLGRNQLVLDMSNPAVLEYLKSTFSETFDGVPIDYIKWDFNRHLSEVGSPALPPERQQEVFYRFQLGVYDLYYWFREHFPGVMIENCSGGGGRYDLAMMALSTQIWTSDNSYGQPRVRIQYGSSVAYPSCVMSCHVANPFREDDWERTWDYTYKVAIGGMLGYELNILNMDENIREDMRRQIAFYRQVEPLIKEGDLYRLLSPFETPGEISAYYYVGEEQGRQRIFLSYLQNFAADPADYRLAMTVAKPDAVYREALTGECYTGEQLRQGIAVTTAADPCSGKIWLFEEVRS